MSFNSIPAFIATLLISLVFSFSALAQENEPSGEEGGTFNEEEILRINFQKI